MLMFGYEKNKEKRSLELSEVTLSCNKEDLDKIIEFKKMFVKILRKIMQMHKSIGITEIIMIPGLKEKQT